MASREGLSTRFTFKRASNKLAQGQTPAICILNNDVLFEIFDYFSVKEYKSLRLVCPRFADLLIPRLFRNITFSFRVQEAVQYCMEHGWYTDLARKYKPCHQARMRSMSFRVMYSSKLKHVKTSGCPFFLSEEGKRYMSGAVDFAPDPIHTLLSNTLQQLQNGRLSRLFAATTAFRVEIPEMGIIRNTNPPLMYEDYFRRLSEELLPQLLNAMPSLQRLYLELRPNHVSIHVIPRAVEAICAVMEAKRPDIEIHVAAGYYGYETYAAFTTDVICSLYGSTGIASITLGYKGVGDHGLDTAVRELVSTSPKFAGPGYIREFLRPGDAWLRPKFFLYVGPKEKRSHGWYLRNQTRSPGSLPRRCRVDEQLYFNRILIWEEAGGLYGGRETPFREYSDL